MKKLNFDPKKLQDFFVNHVEKILFGAVVFGFLWFMQYTFFHREGISGTPRDLERMAEDTFQKIKRPPEKLPVEAKNYEEIIKKTIGRVDPKDYAHQLLWCPPIFDPLPKRGEPRLLTVQDLRGTPGFGKVYVTSAASTGPAALPDESMPPEGAVPPEGAMPTGPVAGLGKENIEGECWVVLTGLVPYEEQIKAYQEAFQAAAREMAGTGGLQHTPAGLIPGAVPPPAAGLMEGGVRGMMGPTAAPTGTSVDIPIYLHYHVQRVEVQSDSDVIDEADWEAGSINIRKAKEEAARRWGSITGGSITPQGPEDIVDPRMLDPALNFPLPRFADGRTLDESFAHPPEIPPLRKRTWQIGPDGRPIWTSPDRLTETTPPGVPEGKPVAPKPATKDLPDLPIGLPGGPAGQGPMPPGAIPGAYPPGVEGYGSTGPMPGAAPGTFSGTLRLPKFKLFRFIDRTVEPGKRYRYRVRLFLANPNYKQPPRSLERPELGNNPWIVTPWSEPSNVVEVPRADRLLVLGVKPSPGYQAEATAKVALLKWIPKEGEMAFKEQERVSRGQLLNLPNQKWPEEDTRKSPSSAPKSPTSKPSAKVPGALGPGMEDYQVLMEAGAPKKKTPREKEKEKTPPTPEGLGFGPPGPQPKAPLDIDYLTECLLIDLRGGYRIDLRGQGRPPHSDANYNAPGEILLLHPDGFLYIQNELDDAVEYEKILQLTAPKYEERFGPGGLIGIPPGLLEGMPPPGTVPGQLAPGETGRPKATPKSPTKTEPRPPTP